MNTRHGHNRHRLTLLLLVSSDDFAFTFAFDDHKLLTGLQDSGSFMAPVQWWRNTWTTTTRHIRPTTTLIAAVTPDTQSHNTTHFITTRHQQPIVGMQCKGTVFQNETRHPCYFIEGHFSTGLNLLNDTVTTVLIKRSVPKQVRADTAFLVVVCVC